MMKKEYEETLRNMLCFVIGFCCAYMFFISVLSLFIVSGESMYPTFYDGDVLKCEKVTGGTIINRGDVVIFDCQMKKLVKRVVAISGDTVFIKDGILYVNDAPSVYNFDDPIEYAGLLEEPITVKPQEYVCLGDNRNNSSDSRLFGPIKKDCINKRVKKVVFSMHN